MHKVGESGNMQEILFLAAPGKFLNAPYLGRKTRIN